VGEAPYRLLTRAARQKDLAAQGSLHRSDLLNISSHINRLLEPVSSFVGLESTRVGRAVQSSPFRGCLFVSLTRSGVDQIKLLPGRRRADPIPHRG